MNLTKQLAKYIVPRFKLRSILVLVTIIVIAILLNSHIQQTRKQERVVRWVKQEGGSVLYEYSYPWVMANGVVHTNYGWEPRFLRELLGEDFFYNVHQVNLFEANVDDISPLSSLSEVKEIILGSTMVSDLSPLKSLTTLTSLRLNSTKVKDLTPLARLVHLELLEICKTPVTDLSPLQSLKNLQWLSINNSSVDKSFSENQIENLQKSLPDCDISREPTKL